MMGWYVAYGVIVLACFVCMVKHFLSKYYFIRLGELFIALLFSLIPVMNVCWIVYILSRCEFWQRKTGSKQP